MKFWILLLSIPFLFNTFSCAKNETSSSAGTLSPREQRFYIKINISAEQHLTNVPYQFYVDFDSILAEKGIADEVDKNSIEMTTSNNEFVHFNLGEDFLYANSGTINLFIEDTDINAYTLWFDTKSSGPWPEKEYVGLVGNGDCLMSNNKTALPLYNGMHSEGHIADIDGDEKNDLISPQYYSHIKGRDWHIVKAYRNEGTASHPVWGKDIPLRTRKNGEIILMNGGITICLTDFDENGLLDILAVGYAKKKADIHLNKGEIDGSGFPLYEFAGSIEFENCTYITAIRYVDLMNSGKKGFLVGRTYPIIHIQRDEPLWFEATEAEKDQVKWPRWYMKSVIEYYETESYDKNSFPLLKKPVELVDTEGNLFTSYTHAGFDLFYNKKNQMYDIIYCKNNGDLSNGGKNSITCPIYMENTGRFSQKGNPVFELKKRYEKISSPRSMYFKLNNSEEYHGMLFSIAGRLKYYEIRDNNRSGYPDFIDKGFIKQHNPYVNSFVGFSKAEILDYDEDGDYDIITGCEYGYSMQIENIGTQEKPIFRDAKLFQENGKDMLHLNGPFNSSESFGEAPIGQTSAYYIDCDYDKILDLIIKIDTKIYFYKNSGTARKPVFTEPVELRTKSGDIFGAGRNHAAVGDFTKNGAIDIINSSKDRDTVLLFRGRKNNDNRLFFENGELLKYCDGSSINPKKWHRYIRHWTFGDWNADGIHDLFVSTNKRVLYLINAGTNENPVFEKPVFLKDGENEMNVGHHVSMPIPVDWDNSGKTDIVISGESGLFYLFRRNYLDQNYQKIRHELIIN